jgi:7,8-dihydroneopterin aldolase/epimerase/oxygenase
MGEIWLEGIEFKAFHGVYEQERKEGNTFVVDLKVITDFSKSAITDNLADTVDYGALYLIVKQEMEIPSNLLEHVAKRILDKILDYSEAILAIEITISKLNPPIEGKAKRSAVKLVYNR